MSEKEASSFYVGHGADTEFPVFTLFAVLIAPSFVLFFLQLGEAVWSKVDVADIVRHERTHGASAATRCAKTILDRKPVAVNYFLLAVFMLMGTVAECHFYCNF